MADLAGKSIAFADPISESGYLYPLDGFVDEGLMARGDDPQDFFDSVYFAGGYQQSIQAVLNGYVDAAGASQFADMLIPPAQLGEITWIDESEPIPSHAVIVREGLLVCLRHRSTTTRIETPVSHTNGTPVALSSTSIHDNKD